MKKSTGVVALGFGVFLASASALGQETDPRCAELQELVLKLSDQAFAPTRDPLIRDAIPERNYIWCLGIGFAKSGEDQPVETLISSFGTEPDGTVWLDFWDKRKEPSFKWKGVEPP